MATFEVHADDADQRVDRYLRKLLPQAPLSMIHRLLRKGDVRVDGRKAKPADRLPTGTHLELRLPEARLAELVAKPSPRAPTATGRLDVLWRDDDLVIVDKPGGLAVHAGSGIGDDHLVARLLATFDRSEAATFRPAPAHRIDRGTSGLVVCGISGRGLRAMTALLRERRVEKQYRAIVERPPEPATGRVESEIDGRPAKTTYRPAGSARDLEVHIDTGRTHQIRVHLESVGAPIVNDVRYGAVPHRGLARGRFALHAERLRFEHPLTGEPLDVTAPLPKDLRQLIDQRSRAR